MPAERFVDQVALVTGGSRGIGRAAATLFAAAGVKVAITYRSRKTEAESFVEEVSRAGGHAMAMQADFADSGAPAVAGEAALKEVRRLHILVNNAGVTRDTPGVRRSEADWVAGRTAGAGPPGSGHPADRHAR